MALPWADNALPLAGRQIWRTARAMKATHSTRHKNVASELDLNAKTTPRGLTSGDLEATGGAPARTQTPARKDSGRRRGSNAVSLTLY
jgi:hypothetical protein